MKADKENINEYISLVRKVAGNFRRYGVDIEDLIQEGLIGILEAKKRYKPEKGAEFATYSSYWIRKRIQQAVRDKLNSEKLFLSDDDIEAGISSITEESGTTEKPNHIGRDLLGLLTSLEKEIIKLYFEEKKTLLEIADLLEISRQRVKQLKQKAMRKIKVNNMSKECE